RVAGAPPVVGGRVIARDAGGDEAGCDVRERVQRRPGPQRVCAQLTGLSAAFAHERVYGLAVMPHLEVDVRELGVARQADQAEPLAGGHGVAGVDRYAPIAHGSVVDL